MPELKGHKPVGSLAEIRKLGLSLNEVMSCSPPGDMFGKNALLGEHSMKAESNRGCPHYGVCRFHEIKGKGAPEVTIFDVIMPDGESATLTPVCFDFYDSGLSERYDNQGRGKNRNGQQIAFLGYGSTYEGMILQKGSRHLHATPKPGCAGCLKGSCTLMVDFEEPVAPPRFRRLGETARHAINTEMRRERMKALAENRAFMDGQSAEPEALLPEAPLRAVIATSTVTDVSIPAPVPTPVAVTMAKPVRNRGGRPKGSKNPKKEATVAEAAEIA